MDSYSAPLNQLLSLGRPQLLPPWADYAAMGIGPEHVPELIRLATDRDLDQVDSESLEVYGPIHAWRALGQLRAEAAIEPLLEYWERADEIDNDWAMEEFPEVFGKIGPSALGPLAARLADEGWPLYCRWGAVTALQKIAQEYPEARGECVAALVRQLEQWPRNDRQLNAALISELMDLKAVETAPLIEQVYAAGKMDQLIAGTWEHAQWELGLSDKKPARAIPPLDELFGHHPLFRSANHAKARAEVRKKKRKAAAKARKRNRQRR
jgi:hypothetical protein